MLKIHIRPAARKDIKKIWGYTFENWGEKQAETYTNELGLGIESLIDNPEKGIIIEHIRKDYRLYHIEHHYVIYRLTSSRIDIVRVLGESMHIKRHL